MTDAEAQLAPLKLPIDFTLTFRDARLEREYLSQTFSGSRKRVIAGLVFGVILVALAAPMDMMNTTPVQQHALHLLRYGVWFPTLIAGLLGAVLSRSAKFVVGLMTGICIYSGACLVLIATPGGPLTMEMVGSVTLALFGVAYFLTGLPFKWAALVALFTNCAQLLAAIVLHPENHALVADIALIALSGSTLAFFAYVMERASRSGFFSRKLLQEEYRRRLDAERDRIHWLENVTGFLRHELKNAMTGIGSSLSLVERSAIDAEAMNYLVRAKHGLDFMRRFLSQVSDATSLESALAQQELEVVNLSQLIEGRVRDYGEEITNRKFITSIQQDIRLLGNADRLVQMLDKLVNNAVEHGAVNQPIEINLQSQKETARLRIRDIGDALPADLQRIFELFVSEKRQHGKGNLGLGLYVARIIAVRHGGTIGAMRLDNPVGAEFTVELPCSPQTAKQVR